jgi:hypothetical protein
MKCPKEPLPNTESKGNFENPENFSAPVQNYPTYLNTNLQSENPVTNYQNINSINYPNDAVYQIHQNLVYTNQPQVFYVVKEQKYEQEENNKFYPSLDIGIAVVILIINIIFPGVGTMIAGCVSGHNVGTFICMGIAQIFLSISIFGWIWAIFTGVMIMSHSKKI